MSDTDEAVRSPEEIWRSASGITHETSYALARIRPKRDSSASGEGDAAAKSQPEGRVRIAASIDETSDSARLGIKLRARVQFARHIVTYEETAEVHFEEPVELTQEEIQAFGNHYMLPFLLPYVEAGLDQMCGQVNLPAAVFPMFVIKGQLYVNDLDEDEESDSSQSDDATITDQS
ncbi:hypothetical protein [Mycolicibacterium lutetiense]